MYLLIDSVQKFKSYNNIFFNSIDLKLVTNIYKIYYKK